MPEVHISVLGRCVVTVDGEPVKVPPIATTILLRLLVAHSQLVTVEQLYQEVWQTTDAPARPARTGVQQRISVLRAILDPSAGEDSAVLRTERGRLSAYRLTLSPEQVDMLAFRSLIESAQQADPAQALELLRQALALWQDQPLFDVQGYAFAERAIQQLHALHALARRTLLSTYHALGMTTEAVRLGTEILADAPGDAEVADLLSRSRQRLTVTRNAALRHELPDSRTAIVVSGGDLLDQDDAHLVIGVSDTFDTAVDHNLVINAASLQGQLLLRIYDGDRARLDREIRRALADAVKVGAETRATKPHGKLTRYEPGTVAVLRHGRRRIFLVAYSVMGNDLIARSSRELLAASLRRLWLEVRQHGSLGAVAIPVLGGGLARIEGAQDVELLQLVLSTFHEATAAGVLCRELRLVLRPERLPSVTGSLVAILRDTYGMGAPGMSGPVTPGTVARSVQSRPIRAASVAGAARVTRPLGALPAARRAEEGDGTDVTSASSRLG